MEEISKNHIEDAEEVVAKVIKSIDIVSKQKKQGFYIENIANTCYTEFGWPKDMTIASLKRAEELDRIYITVSSNKQSYRIKNPSVTPCHDELASTTQPGNVHETNSSTTLDAFQRDFEDFKRFSHAEILSLKAQISPKSHESPTRSSQGRIEAMQEALIRSLHERIFSLERQLSDKQEIIQKLLENSFERPLRPTETHSPMGTTTTPQPVLNKEASKKSMNNKQTVTKSTGTESIATNKINPGESCESASDDKRDDKHEKKRVIIVGDSILNGINEKGLTKKNHTVKVRPHPGATTEDLVDHIKPVARRKPNMVILHIGSNDLTNGVNTQEKLLEVIDILRKESKDTKIVVSSVVTRKDKNGMPNKVSSLNSSLKTLCIRNQIEFIDNCNLDDSCLGVKRLHLNKKGNSYLANNCNKFLEKA